MRVAVIGTGLIGSSVSKGLRESGFAETVLGLDTNPKNSAYALESKYLDGILELGSQDKEIDLWVICTPPDGVLPWLSELEHRMGGESVVTDCASVKAFLYGSLSDKMRKRFVGGHPMAGGTTTGPEGSKADLFAEHPWILTPEEAEPDAIRGAERMIYALDAIPIRMSAVDHDLHVARLSHLPTLLANLLAAMGQNLPSVHIGGGSWRDLTRVAGANPVLWEQILRHNRDEVLSAVGELRASLAEVECALAENNPEDLKRLIDHQS